MGGGGPDPTPSADALLAPAWRLDKAAVRVLAVKRLEADFQTRMIFAAQTERTSIVVAHVGQYPEESDLTYVHVVVYGKPHTYRFADLAIHISPEKQIVFVPRNGPVSIAWHDGALVPIAGLVIHPDDLSDGLNRASRYLRLAVRPYPEG